jgi:hypothetical protein
VLTSITITGTIIDRLTAQILQEKKPWVNEETAYNQSYAFADTFASLTKSSEGRNGCK